MSDKDHDPRTGRIGRERYPDLVRLIVAGRTASQIAFVFGINPETIRKFARKRGLAVVPGVLSGREHPCWVNGMTTDSRGYTLVRVLKSGDFGYLIRAIAKRSKNGTDPSGYAPLHRILMHQILGRELLPGEVVDHDDHDKKNNDPENLVLYPSNAAHLRATLKGRRPNWTPEGFAKMKGRPRKTLVEACLLQPTQSH